MWILSIFSVGILLWIVYFFIRQNRNHYYAIFGLFIKILAGIGLGLIYKYHYQGGDTFQYFSDAGVLSNFILTNPQKIFDVLLNTSIYTDLENQLVYLDQPRALFFSKIITPLYIITGGNYWLMSIALSMANFACIYIWIKELSKNYTNIYSIAVLTRFTVRYARDRSAQRP